MLYDLLAPAASQFILFNLFRYITFRTGGAVLTALVVSFILGPPLIRWLKSLQRERPADPHRRTRTPSDREEGHADHGRRADPVRPVTSPRCCGPICATAMSGSVLFVTLGYRLAGLRRRLPEASRSAAQGRLPERMKLAARP